MRRQFLYAGLLSAFAGVLVGVAGCDDVTTGQTPEKKGPPALIRVLVQDAWARARYPNRSSVVDLIDNAAPVACSPTNPCSTEFSINYGPPGVECSSSTGDGVCSNPFQVPASGVPLALPWAGAPPMRDAGSGKQIRIVFDKKLDPAPIEMVKIDPNGKPGSNATYTMTPGILELVDDKGMEVKSTTYYDIAGSPFYTSDLEIEPLGPALVIKPTVLAPASTYTIKLTTAKLKDSQGNSPVDKAGAALPAVYSVTFKTEGLTSSAAAGTDFPDFSDPAKPPTILPNQVLQFGFWAPVKGDAVTDLKVTGPANKAIAYSDRGADATMCTKAATTGPMVDVANSDGMGLPADWAPGDYTISFTVEAAEGGAKATQSEVKFKVAGAADPKDANGYQSHVTPAQCTGM